MTINRGDFVEDTQHHKGRVMEVVEDGAWVRWAEDSLVSFAKLYVLTVIPKRS